MRYAAPSPPLRGPYLFCHGRKDMEEKAVREVLIKSAAVDGERFFVKTRFEKRRNTVCISRFSNRRIGGKDPSSAVGDLFRGSLGREIALRA